MTGSGFIRSTLTPVVIPPFFPLRSMHPISPCHLEYTFLARCRTRTRNKQTNTQPTTPACPSPALLPSSNAVRVATRDREEDNRGRSQGTAFKGIIFPTLCTFRLAFSHSRLHPVPLFFSFLPVLLALVRRSNYRRVTASRFLATKTTFFFRVIQQQKQNRRHAFRTKHFSGRHPFTGVSLPRLLRHHRPGTPQGGIPGRRWGSLLAKKTTDCIS